jgi:hypothetical protein
MAAKLPHRLIEPPAQYLKDMPVGETWYIGFTSLHVDGDLSVT